MKYLIFILLLGLSLVSAIEAECEFATPRYGVVQCINTNQEETISASFGDFDGEWSHAEINCLSNCNIQSMEDISIYCEGVPWDESKIFLNGGERSPPLSWNIGDNFLVKGRCTWAFGNDPVPTTAEVQYLQDRIMLYEGWAGSLPNTPISGSEGCVLNKDMDEEPNINSYLDPNTGIKENKEASSFPSSGNWEINDHYIFVKDWQTGISDISLTYDKENNAYWCGGQYGSRKIYSVKEVSGNSGQCYSVPQSIELSNIECCFPSDCNNEFGAEYTCNPENWKCEKTKPCNSQIDCESTFGEGVCQSGQINKWICDLNKKWGDYSGTCVHSSKLVSDCPGDCSNNEYYNEEQGKCLTRAGLISKNINDSSEEFTSSSKGFDDSSSAGVIILVIFLILIGGSVIFFFYVKGKKKVKHKSKSKSMKIEEEKTIKKQMGTGKYCTKCGYLMRKKSVFCTMCGKKSK